MARTVVNDTASKVELAAALASRASVTISNQSSEILDVYFNGAESVATVLPAGHVTVGPEYTGPIQGKWRANGAGLAIIVELDGDGSEGAQTALSAHIADTTAAHAASAVSFAPSGGLSSTNAQAAIEEVVTDLVAFGAAVYAPLSHVALATDAHDASAVSVVPAATLTGVNVQLALEALAARIDVLEP